jgi:DNA-binding HxlR family transcriptional regulator
MDTGFDLRKHGGVEVFLRDCPTRAVLELIAGKWTMLVLVALENGRPMRFTELRRRLDGVTAKVLTQTLRALEREGLLIRTVYPTVPPRVEYRLTELGQEVGGLVRSITDWSQANISAIHAAREEFDERTTRPPRCRRDGVFGLRSPGGGRKPRGYSGWCSGPPKSGLLKSGLLKLGR